MPVDQAENNAAWITSEMTQAVKLNVPLKVDVAIGPTWLEEK
jgi:DNA polymerase I-like protein with 3'-5' exonuclease and polymerase domains